MAYIGTSPSNGVRRVHTYTATANQTTFTGSSTEGVTLTYADTNYIDVFQNGVLLGSADYTSTSGTSVVLAQGASVSDLVVIVVYDVFSVADTVSKTAGGTFDGGITVSGASTLTGALSAKGGAVFNEDSADVDFRVESNGDANCLFVDGGNDKVGIGTNAPQGFLSINKNANGSALPHIHLIDNSDAREAFVTNNSGDLILGTMNSSDDTIDSSVTVLTSTIVLRTAGADRMTIDSSGNLLVGTTSSPSSNSGGVGFVSAGAYGVFRLLTSSNNTATVAMVQFENPNGTVGSISLGGSSSAYNTSSDHRLKESVTYDFDATTRLKQLKPARFNFIADETNTLVDGFLAHEVQAIVPECVTGTHNEVDDDGNPVMQGIDQSKLVPLLVKTIQELEARITTLENA